ncbi:MAG: non-hydrolyzing UDP-N-acetylglucosamine 2-epimerase [Candidatus Kapaibacterium sp.]
MKRVISVVGARPNFMKAAPVASTLSGLPDVEHLLVHTGQHYDANMSDVFFSDLGMAPPDLHLEVGSGSHAEQTAKIMIAFERDVCLALKPDLVVVYGDINSTVAAAIVAKKLHIPVAHVESGLRSHDRKMPEEINRVITDSICDLHFVTEESGRANLLREGIDPTSIHFVGNTMIDSLAALVRELPPPDVEDDYLVLTLHRPSNVDDHESLERLLTAIRSGAGDMKIRFPVHPRTNNILTSSGLAEALSREANWELTEPAGYREFITLVRGARGVITDSGGIQEETTWLGVPCVTLRESTERPSTVELGTNMIVGVIPAQVERAIRGVVSHDRPSTFTRPPLWDGIAAERIARIIHQFLNDNAG